MLDSSLTPTMTVEPFRSPNPACPYRFHAFLGGGASQVTGAGETEFEAVFDLVEMLLETGQPGSFIVAVIESVTRSPDLCTLIDWMDAIDGGDAYIPAAIAHLETIDPLAAAERRKWL